MNLRGNNEDSYDILMKIPFLKINISKLCLFVNEIIDDMDLSKYEEQYEDARCKNSYSRAMLLKIVSYGLLNGVLSSRKLEYEVKHNFEYMFLAGLETPSYRTILRFKNKDYEMMEELFLKTVDYAYERGYVEFNTILYDGTTKQAHANTYKRLNQTEIDYLKKFLKSSLEQEKTGIMEYMVVNEDPVKELEAKKKFSKNFYIK